MSFFPKSLENLIDKFAALPGVMIFVTSISFNLLSDGLRSAMEVKA